jgi:hypothetical protein
MTQQTTAEILQELNQIEAQTIHNLKRRSQLERTLIDRMAEVGAQNITVNGIKASIQKKRGRPSPCFKQVELERRIKAERERLRQENMEPIYQAERQVTLLKAGLNGLETNDVIRGLEREIAELPKLQPDLKIKIDYTCDILDSLPDGLLKHILSSGATKSTARKFVMEYHQGKFGLITMERAWELYHAG